MAVLTRFFESPTRNGRVVFHIFPVNRRRSSRAPDSWALVLVLVSLGMFAGSTPAQEGSGSARQDVRGRAVSEDLNCLGELTAAYEALEENDLGTAQRHYDLALEKADSSALEFQALFGLGLTLSGMGRTEEAVRALEKAREIRPEHGETLYLLGSAYRALGRVDEAVATLEESTRWSPDLVASHRELGLLYAELGWNDQAARSFRRVVAAAPDDVEALLGLAVALYHLGSYEEAATRFREVLSTVPDNPRALYGLGLALLYAERVDEAVVQYRRLEPLDGDLARDLHHRILSRER
jgi:tetratricopeptide (TPR) repeat protein